MNELLEQPIVQPLPVANAAQVQVDRQRIAMEVKNLLAELLKKNGISVDRAKEIATRVVEELRGATTESQLEQLLPHMAEEFQEIKAILRIEQLVKKNEIDAIVIKLVQRLIAEHKFLEAYEIAEEDLKDVDYEHLEELLLKVENDSRTLDPSDFPSTPLPATTSSEGTPPPAFTSSTPPPPPPTGSATLPPPPPSTTSTPLPPNYNTPKHFKPPVEGILETPVSTDDEFTAPGVPMPIIESPGFDTSREEALKLQAQTEHGLSSAGTATHSFIENAKSLAADLGQKSLELGKQALEKGKETLADLKAKREQKDKEF